MLVSLNIKDEEAVALLSEVARLMGVSKTAAVRALAQEKLDSLNSAQAQQNKKELAKIFAWYEKNIWPHTVDVKAMTKEEEEELLGYDEIYK
jgi:hypothetical protein